MEVHLMPEQKAQAYTVGVPLGNRGLLFRDTVLHLIEGNSGVPDKSSGSVVAEMRALRAGIKPDPEGWTTRDYVLSGRG